LVCLSIVTIVIDYLVVELDIPVVVVEDTCAVRVVRMDDEDIRCDDGLGVEGPK